MAASLFSSLGFLRDEAEVLLAVDAVDLSRCRRLPRGLVSSFFLSSVSAVLSSSFFRRDRRVPAETRRPFTASSSRISESMAASSSLGMGLWSGGSVDILSIE